jgi:uncharacterized protein YbaP (TraB family)
LWFEYDIVGRGEASLARTESVVMRLLRFALCFVAFVLGSVRGAAAYPALWVVEGAHAKVYLFGTVHVLKPDRRWHSPALDAAIAESRELWLEVPDGGDVTAVLPSLESLGLDPTHPLSSKLSKPDLARVDAAARAMGAPGEAAFEPFRPWFVGVTLSMLPLLKAGYDPNYGVDQQLRSTFVAAGKPVRGFETLEQQLHFFADLPQDQEVAFLDTTLDSLDSAASSTDRDVALWSDGNVTKLAALEDDDIFRRSPALYNELVVSRNAAWAQQLDARLRQGGVSFVAVGAAHLAGPASVQVDLTKRGYRVRRVQ